MKIQVTIECPAKFALSLRQDLLDIKMGLYPGQTISVEFDSVLRTNLARKQDRYNVISVEEVKE
jgi:hypothetical protein